MNVLQAMYGAREEKGQSTPPGGSGLGQVPEVDGKPFLRRDNPWMWVILAGAAYLAFQMMRPKRRRVRVKIPIESRRENPRLPSRSTRR